MADYPAPKDVHKLRQYLGLANYYRRFVQDFSQIAEPLHQLTRKTAKGFQWSSSCQEAFEELKRRLVSPPILAYPDFTLPFLLHTDASANTIGAVLSQTQDGNECVISYWSRQLNKSERNYSTIEREALAAVAAIKEFYPYLYGFQFKVVTDHNPLTALKGLKDVGGRLSRWMIFLQQFNYTIEYRPGRKHANADALSRRPHQSDHPGGIGDEGVGGFGLSDDHDASSVGGKGVGGLLYLLESSGGAGGVGGHDEASDDHDASGVGGNGVGGLLYPLEKSGGAGGSGGVGGCGEGGKGSGAGDDTVCTIDQLFNSEPIDIKTTQANDAKLKPLLDALADGDFIPSTHPGLKTCFIKDSLLCREIKGVHNTYIQVILPSSLVPTVLRQLHDNGGHLGVHKTLDKVKERYYWPGYEQDVKTWTRECEQCQQRNPPQPQPQAPLGTIKATKPFQKVSWDIMGPLPPSESGNKYILVVTDLFTKWVEAFPIHDTTSATLATVLVDQFISRYGVPVVLHSDQGANLCSEVIKTICKLLGMDQTRTSAYHPQGNGKVERFNRMLEAMLAKNVKDNQRDWDQWLQKVLFAYRTSLHETTGFTPFHLVFGRTPNLPVDRKN